MIVPAVVEEKRIELDAALFSQLAAEEVDAIECVGLAIGSEVAEIVPGVVVEKGAVGMGPLFLEVSEEIAAQLSGARHAEDR